MYTYHILFTLLTLLTLTSAGIDEDDIPSQCTEICAGVLQISRDCDPGYDSDTEENQAKELTCVCAAPNAAAQFPMCDACVQKFSNEGAENDINEYLRSCSFPTATFAVLGPPTSTSASSLQPAISFANAPETSPISTSAPPSASPASQSLSAPAPTISTSTTDSPPPPPSTTSAGGASIAAAANEDNDDRETTRSRRVTTITTFLEPTGGQIGGGGARATVGMGVLVGMGVGAGWMGW